MNQKSEEETIKRLFRETRQADSTFAPDFAATIEAARSRRREVRPRRMALRPAVVTISLVLLAAFAVVVLIRSATGPSAPVASEPSSSVVKPSAVLAGVKPPTVNTPVRPASPIRPRRTLPGRATTLISQWRSPTDFLLNTPGNELLKTLPRIGDSSIDIRMNIVDRKN
ncbi:MAG: hypothetical protein AABO41_18510 [Acidobacteriota bacterium]